MCITNNGHFKEAVILGTCTAPNQGYLKRDRAIMEVMRNQPKATPTALRLRNAVAERFGGYGVNVRYFTAVGSALDHYHGIDAFLSCGDVMVSIDLTSNATKTTGKADLIVQEDELEDLPKLARHIALVFIEKLKERRALQRN